MSDTLTIIAAVNDDKILGANLLRSPIFDKTDAAFVRAEGFPGVGQAYNYGIRQSSSEVLIFVHQDVYLPARWYQRLQEGISAVEKIDPNWAVLGVIGSDRAGCIKGSSWSTGLSKVVGVPITEAVPAISLDEIVLVIKKDSRLIFDETLPGWHLYGTDIVQTAIQQGYGAFIIDAPVIHNSLPILKFDAGFINTYRYLQKKWFHRLPIKTPCVTITRYGWPLYKSRIKRCFKGSDRTAYRRLTNPALKAKELGYE